MNRRLLVMLAEARTGGSYFRHIINSSGIFHCRDELFHKSRGPVFSRPELAAFSAQYGVDTSDKKSFAEWRHSHINETLHVCFGNSDRWGLFKVAPSQFSRAELETSFLYGSNFKFIVLRRRPIESFISREKAKILKRWEHVDTTELKPELDVFRFVRWCEAYKESQDWISQSAFRNPHQYMYVDYDEFSNLTAEQFASWDFWSRLSNFLSTTVRPDFSDIKHIRQDQEPDYRKRVSNWFEFESLIKARPKHNRWLDWAERNSLQSTSFPIKEDPLSMVHKQK